MYVNTTLIGLNLFSNISLFNYFGDIFVETAIAMNKLRAMLIIIYIRETKIVIGLGVLVK